MGRGVHEVGMVWLDETMHAHMGQHNRRVGFPVHAWRVLPRRKGEVTSRPRIKKRTLEVRVIAGHGAQTDVDHMPYCNGEHGDDISCVGHMKPLHDVDKEVPDA